MAKTRAGKNSTTANLGFEASLWAAADATPEEIWRERRMKTNGGTP